MKKGVVGKTRLLLIQIGKTIPFVMCLIACISYIEDINALVANDYIEFQDGIYLNKPISWAIAKCFEYESPTIVVISILSVAIQTCIYNKFACAYLAINLYEKSLFANYEFENNVYYTISIINIMVCTFLCYKGTKILYNSRKRKRKWK